MKGSSVSDKKARSFIPTSRSVTDDDQATVFNPDPVPFHSQVFQSSTIVKKVPNQGRHPAMWASDVDNVGRTKGYIVHTDRYKWEDMYSAPDEFTQRGRLQIEQEYVDRLRSIRRRREIIPHRESQEFVMGGQKAELNERDDVMQELKKLKGILLPTAAKDLYVGRGFSRTLPKDHALNKPRQTFNYNQFLPLQNALDHARGVAPKTDDSQKQHHQPPTFSDAPDEHVTGSRSAAPYGSLSNGRDAENSMHGVMAVNYHVTPAPTTTSDDPESRRNKPKSKTKPLGR